MLDELALRRPSFREGMPIVLGDGQTWSVPAPVFGGWAPAPTAEDGRFAFEPIRDEYSGLLDELVACEDGWAEKGLLAGMLFRLLSRNYDLAPADMGALLPLLPLGHPGREANEALWSAVLDVCTGRAPKTYARWLRVALLANGVSLPLPLADAEEVAAMLVATGRAVPAVKWCPDLAARDEARRASATAPHNNVFG